VTYVIFLLVFFIAFSCSKGDIIPHNNQVEKEIHFLSSKEAHKYGYKGFNRNKWAYPKEWLESMDKATAAEPLLVHRIDREKNYYYIVPFNVRNKTKLLVIIDAISGKFKEVSYLKELVSFPKISKAKAINIMMKFLKERKIKIEILSPKLTLVWKPCEQTQSPYEPLWKVQIRSEVWFIDQKGKIYDKILKPKVKGGTIRKKH